MNTNEILSKISIIKDLSDKYIENELKANGFEKIVPSHGEIIYLLCKKDGPITISEIVEATHKPKSTLTSNLRTLKKYGYINRIINPNDSRSCHIELTDKGKKLIPIFKKISSDINKILYENMNIDEIEGLTKSIEIIKENLENNNKE